MPPFYNVLPTGTLRYIEPQHDNSKGSGRESHDLDWLSVKRRGNHAWLRRYNAEWMTNNLMSHSKNLFLEVK